MSRFLPRYVLLCVVSSISLLSIRAAEPPPARQWSAGFLFEFAHDGPSIILGYLRQDASHLTGTFTFENISGSRAQAKNITLEGVEGEGGQFWPVVRYEARRGANGAWEPIGGSSVTGQRRKLMIKAESSPVELSVTLDIFKPFIGKYEFGRIVLGSGDTSEFQLEDLTGESRTRESFRSR